MAAAQPDNLRAVLGLGAALSAQGKYDAAEKELRRAHKLAPDSVEVNYQLGNTLYKKGVYAAAATAAAPRRGAGSRTTAPPSWCWARR